MNISPFFRHLRSAYAAELDDLCTDSEGLHVLDKRLTQRRKEMEFLVHMMEISPEMVATVLHRGFRFKGLAVMDHLVSMDADHIPDWTGLSHAVQLEPWTKPLVETVLKHDKGDWFLCVAAALEYLHTQPEHASVSHDEEADEDSEDDGDDGHDGNAPLDEEERAARAREKAGADWMEAQGFDRKD